ncbi:Zn-ribbon domain-containing OB-fold protein [Comamonas sp.]|uniref:Zn-ribbon domain-containing OB-fold protein n=1 Tax=Comamonas sp. TaxID=34028 RepID=UPI003A8F4C2F
MIERSEAPLAHPSLYGVAPGGAPVVFAARCAQCSRIGFPRQSYGCEACGAHGEALSDVDLPATGELISFAEVHRHHGTDIDTPFVMAEIRLDSGLLLRGTLAPQHADGLKIGARLFGTLVAGRLPGAALELRFAPEGN